MSYENPTRVLDKRFENFSKSLASFNSSLSQTLNTGINAYKSKLDKEEAEAEKVLEDATKREELGQKELNDQYLVTMNKINKMTGQMGDKEDAGLLNEQIKDNLKWLASDLKREIKDAGADASDDQIRDLTNAAILRAQTLHTDMGNVAAAYQEFQQFKSLPLNEQDAIIASGEMTNQMLSMFKSFEDGKQNVFISPSSDGQGWSISQFDYEKPRNSSTGELNIKKSVDLTGWRKISEKEGFFKQTEKTDFKQMKSDMDAMIEDDAKLSNPQFTMQVPDGVYSTGKPKYKTVIDESKWDAWTESPVGQEFFDLEINQNNLQGQFLGMTDRSKETKKIKTYENVGMGEDPEEVEVEYDQYSTPSISYNDFKTKSIDEKRAALRSQMRSNLLNYYR